MKTFTLAIRPIFLTLLSAGLVAVSQATIRARVDGVTVDFPDGQLTMINNRVMVPLRGIFEKMNASVEYDQTTRSITAMQSGNEIRLILGSKVATINGSDLTIDVAPYTSRGSTMVPLRFIGEAMKAQVDWVEATQSVEIMTIAKIGPPMNMPGFMIMKISSGTVVPFRLNDILSSKSSRVGDSFKATLGAKPGEDYMGLPAGTQLDGHIDFVRSLDNSTPGVLGLAFDWIRLPDGQSYPLYGTLARLDNTEVDPSTGRLTAKSVSKNGDLKLVGYGAAGGLLLSLATKGNVVNNTLLGSALGYLLGQLTPDEKKSTEIVTTQQMKFGVRLDRDLMFRVKMVVNTL